MLVTVADDKALRQAAAKTGIIDFVVNPIKPCDLHARCQNHLLFRKQRVEQATLPSYANYRPQNRKSKCTTKSFEQL